MRRALVFLLLSFGMAAPAAAHAQNPAPPPPPAPPPEPVIRAGVSVANVQVGGQTVRQATATLEQAFAAPFAANVVVAVAGKRFVLKPKAIRFTFLANLTAQRALAAGVASPPAADGTVTPVAVPPEVSFRRARVNAWVAKIAKRVAVPARDARIRITLRRIVRLHSKAGRRLDARAVRTAVRSALSDPLAPRLLKPGRATLVPKIRVKDLGKANPTIITIDRTGFRLRLFKRLHLAKSYGVAVGMPAYPTPTGLYSISSKQVNPTWTAPNSPWAGELAGQSVSGNDPSNPLRARWMGIVDGVGIHGTAMDWSIGTRASHGCIRMHVPDVIDLYNRVPIGAPVYIR
jgi:lipoprotein-anchoring transpeptidase ErfK/SrfK